MKPWVENLLALQSIDLKLRSLNVKLETVPVEKKRLESELTASGNLVTAAANALRKVEKEIKEKETETAAVEESIRKLLVQSSMVKKNNEYQAMMTDIEGKKAQISERETKILELMDLAESASAALKKAEQAFAQEQKSVKAELKDLAELEQEIRDEMLSTKSLRKADEGKVETKVLDLYSRLLKDKKNMPLAPIDQGSICGNCRLRVTPQTVNDAKKGAITLCDNCSHMLYIPGPVEEA